jgi:hypothetical protein
VAAAVLVMKEKSMASSTAVRIVRPKKGTGSAGPELKGRGNGSQLPGFPWTPYTKGRVDFTYVEGNIHVILLGSRLA